MLQLDRRSAYEEEHELFRDSVRKFIGKEIAPHQDRWEKEGIVERSFWLAAGEAGLPCPGISPEYGGLGLDFRYNAVVDEALRFTKGRKAFGRTVLDFQNTRFMLADLAAKLRVGWAYLDRAINRHIAGKLDAVEASAAKLWHTELQWEVVDKTLQLHGGAGYMNEYAIARLRRDAHVTRIFGGASEIMKEIAGRSLKDKPGA